MYKDKRWKGAKGLSYFLPLQLKPLNEAVHTQCRVRVALALIGLLLNGSYLARKRTHRMR